MNMENVIEALWPNEKFGTWHIHSVHEQMRQELGAIEVETLEHISSKLVEQMNKVWEDVQQEVEAIMKIC